MHRFHVMLRFKGENRSHEKFLDFSEMPSEAAFLMEFQAQISPKGLKDIELMSVITLPPSPVPQWLDRRFTGAVMSGLYGDKKLLEKRIK